MIEMQHPDLPDRTITAGPKQARILERSGWRSVDAEPTVEPEPEADEPLDVPDFLTD